MTVRRGLSLKLRSNQKQKTNLGQSQKFVMLPQMQQAIRMLSLPLLEMNQVITQAMIENPLLETEENFDYEEQEHDSSEDFQDTMDKVDMDWDESSSDFVPSGDAGPTIDPLANSSKEQTLVEHLEWQLVMESLNQEDSRIALEIIHNLSDEGLLETPLEELAKAGRWDWQQALRIRTLIQHLDPIGCGSDNWREALLFQARMVGYNPPLLEKVLQEYREDWNDQDSQHLALKLGLCPQEVKKVLQTVQEFHPRPGLLISGKAVEYTVPDVHVVESGGKFVVKVNEHGMPDLRLSPTYKRMASADKTDNKTRKYLQENIDKATWLLRAIQSRQKTLHQVTSSILARQQDFFKSNGHLKPMVLKDIAKEIGVHESTVSRTVTNKYMQTPKGVFELKHFFTKGISGEDGVAISSKVVMLKIKSWIDSEDPLRPLSDQQISELLEKEGVSVARRTVAKYRGQLGVPAVSKRRKRGEEELCG